MVSLNVVLNDPNVLYDGVLPSSQAEDEESVHNTNMLASFRQHQHTLIYLLLHTAVGATGDERVLYYENDNYIEDDNGIMLAVE